MADLSITAASVVHTSGPSDHGTAGATITAGQGLYKDASDSNKLKLAQSDGTAAEADAVGVALHAALSGQPIRYATTGAVLNIGATTSKTAPYVVSTAAGGIAPLADLTSGHRIVYLGFAPATDGTFHVLIKNMNAVV